MKDGTTQAGGTAGAPDATAEACAPSDAISWSTWLLVGALVIGAFAAGPWTFGSRGPAPGEATALLAAGSLAGDGDLRFTEEDLARGSRAWPQGPAGLRLARRSADQPFVFKGWTPYAVLAGPFAALGGRAGLAFFNGLLLVLLALALRALPSEGGSKGLSVGLAAAGTLAPVFFLRLGPVPLAMLCAFLPLVLSWRGDLRRPRLGPAALCGALLAVAVWLEPLTLWLAVVPLAEVVGRRLPRQAVALLTGAALVVGGLLVLERKLTGLWLWDEAPAAVFVDRFPVETPGLEVPSPPSPPAVSVKAFLVGRHGGLVAYFPFALFALVGALGRSRGPLWLALALGGALITRCLVPEARPLDPPGDPGLAVLAPAFLLLALRGLSKPLIWLTALAAVLWTIPAQLACWSGGSGPEGDGRSGASMRRAAASCATAPSFRLLPVELGRLRSDAPRGGDPAAAGLLGSGLPGYAARLMGPAVWIAPLDTVYLEERHPDGVWLAGSSRSEIFLSSPRPLDSVTLTVRALSDRATVHLDGGAETVGVRFDQPGKRQGVSLELALRAVGPGPGAYFPGETLYRVVVQVGDGLVPSRIDRRSSDGRNLGVFLELSPAEAEGEAG